MRNRMAVLALIVMTGVGFVVGLLVESRMQRVQAQARPESAFPAIPGQKGGEDITGPYEPVADWPKPLSSLPGHENWTWGAVEGIFAEGPVASLPGGGAPGDLPEDSDKHWSGKVGVDARWEHNLVVVDASGQISEDWTKWDNFFKRPHGVYINPYDAEKNVWVVDDYKHAVFKFSHDGKTLLQTIGTPDQSGADDKHFNRPTFLAWLPDSTMFVSDGYNGTRVAKFDKNGKFLLAWGEKGVAPNEMRPGYFNVVHGIAADPVTHRVYVVDRANHRIQVFDENGKFVDQWALDKYSSVNFLYMSADRNLWAADDRNSKIVEYDLEGHLLYAWGTLADWPGGLFNTHGMSVDQEGNFYVAEVGNGRAQKFRPRPGANPALLVGKPVYAAWK